jgi:hypothetical protein
MRDNMVRLSDEEHAMLTDYQDENYPNVPLGAVIKILIEKDE